MRGFRCVGAGASSLLRGVSATTHSRQNGRSWTLGAAAAAGAFSVALASNASISCEDAAAVQPKDLLAQGKVSPKYFDHTILKPDSKLADVDKVCDEALEYGFYSVCVNSAYVPHVAERLRGSDVRVCAVIGFPLGAMMTAAKVVEAQMCLAAGATEIDMVANTGLLKSGDYNAYRQDVEAVAQVCKSHRAKLKVILETCLLTEEEKYVASRLALGGGADFLKTSTGFSTGGATPADVHILSELAHKNFTTRRNTLGKKEVTNAFCKASGGIRTGATALEMIEAGADRLGTSATVQVYREANALCEEFTKKNK
jgi:deoxyribose-phosphate aldolase